MLRYAAISLIVALVSLAFLLFSHAILGGAIWLAKGVFVVALILFVVFFVLNMVNLRKKKKKT